MHLKRLYQLLGAMALSACFSIGAQAQSNSNDVGIGASPLLQPAHPAEPYPAPGVVSQGYFFNLRGLGTDLGKTLADYGIYLNGRTINEGIGNIAGGNQKGVFYQGFVVVGVDFDLSKIANIPSASVHVSINDLTGVPTLPYTGAAFPFNRVFAINAGARLNELSYEQGFFNDILDVRLGRLPVGTEFDFEDFYCEFINAICGTPAAFGSIGKGFPAYDASVWASVVRLQLPSHFYFRIAAYEDEPLLNTINHDGWPGEDWDFSKGTGVTIPMQFGYHTGFNSSPYPSSFSLGGMYDTGPYSDPLFNTLGLNRILNGGTARQDIGRSQMWVQASQVVWRPDMTNRRALTFFTGANFQTSGYNSMEDGFFGGWVLNGLFAERPNDTINFQFQYYNLNPLFTTAQNSLLQLQHSTKTLANNEKFIEFNYGLAIAPGITLRPFVQYIWNPDQSGVAKVNANITHAALLGLSISAFWPETFGMPRLDRPGGV